MAWATPTTFSVGTVLTAAEMNVIGNDLKFLAGPSGLYVATTVNTASTSFVTLTGGPAVTVTTGAHAIVMLSAVISNSVGGTMYSQMAYKISGATTRAASITTGLSQNSTTLVSTSVLLWVKTLTAGSNTFTSQYSVSASSTAHFGRRTIIVIPLP